MKSSKMPFVPSMFNSTSARLNPLEVMTEFIQQQQNSGVMRHPVQSLSAAGHSYFHPYSAERLTSLLQNMASLAPNRQFAHVGHQYEPSAAAVAYEEELESSSSLSSSSGSSSNSSGSSDFHRLNDVRSYDSANRSPPTSAQAHFPFDEDVVHNSELRSNDHHHNHYEQQQQHQHYANLQRHSSESEREAWKRTPIQKRILSRIQSEEMHGEKRKLAVSEFEESTERESTTRTRPEALSVKITNEIGNLIIKKA